MDEFYQQYIRPLEPKLIRAAWRLLGDEHEAGDALQDALARIWKHRWKLKSHPNPSAWMLRIVLNAAHDRLRLRQARRAKVLPDHIASSAPSPPLVVQKQESMLALLDEISRLSPKQTQAVLLRFVECLPYDAVAEALGCSEATARVHVQRGRERLRERLAHLDPLMRRSPT
jgi:RNA polymerase sigma factor (sigma-70 family)